MSSRPSVSERWDCADKAADSADVLRSVGGNGSFGGANLALTVDWGAAAGFAGVGAAFAVVAVVVAALRALLLTKAGAMGVEEKVRVAEGIRYGDWRDLKRLRLRWGRRDAIVG
jgi:hypothetical protein